MCRVMWPSFHWRPKPVALGTKLKPNPITLTPEPTIAQTNHMTPYWEGTKWQAKEGNSTHHSQNCLSPCGTHLKKLWRRSPCPSVLPCSCTYQQDNGDLALPKPPPRPPAFFCCAFHMKGRNSLHGLAVASARPRQSPSCETSFYGYLHARIRRQLTPLEVTDATPIAAATITSAWKATREKERTPEVCWGFGGRTLVGVNRRDAIMAIDLPDHGCGDATCWKSWRRPWNPNGWQLRSNCKTTTPLREQLMNDFKTTISWLRVCPLWHSRSHAQEQSIRQSRSHACPRPCQDTDWENLGRHLQIFSSFRVKQQFLGKFSHTHISLQFIRGLLLTHCAYMNYFLDGETPALATEYKPRTHSVIEFELSTPTLWEEGSSTVSFHPGQILDLIIQVQVFSLKIARNKPTNCPQPVVLHGGASKTLWRGKPTHQ
jgi:hypothetical protein